jgi:hypothetical protein
MHIGNLPIPLAYFLYRISVIARAAFFARSNLLAVQGIASGEYALAMTVR